MSEVETSTPHSVLQARLARVHELLQPAEAPQPAAEAAAPAAGIDSRTAQLTREIEGLHPADIAFILETLPPAERREVWNLVKADQDGEILLEVSDAVRESLLADMDKPELLAATEQLDAEEIADLAEDLPEDVLQEVLHRLNAEERRQVQTAMAWEDDQVGAIMDFDMVTIREDVTLETVLRYLRRLKELPEQTDKLFVVNHDMLLTGVLPIRWLLVNDPAKLVSEVMAPDANTFHPEDDVAGTAQAFERYDLVTAPVVDADGRLIGRVTINAMVDVIREESDAEVRERFGLLEDEDMFASVWRSLRNRWAWLAINLVTAFIASRVIGVFEGSIQKLVALAALMPIVAGIGGNSGNQTITMIVRALALGQVSPASARRLLRKELGVALVNGLIWGGVIGVVAVLLYDSVPLGLVMTAAMTLNLLLAACMGVLIPMTLLRFGRDPAMGSSVMITALTDSGGFFIFLGLATLFLI
ncbi:MAG: magnesium transporter [Dokdonella sp.]|uniref:magnesium transporter n=1 Tax=Dokdonella sp. TaxID=2291710 RepID=UPI0025BCE43E|nr:magnesium transporter [Dokdonella sp.]MBX3700911.1 magnesium transporter [Dokdonella sp.]MCW5578083.1 magnesium transporter [Dokdonella sp.]